jgi:hydrogenase maturation protease
MTPSILIAGIGNIFLGDDAFGSDVARLLMERTWPDNVRVSDFGIRGFDLMFALLDGFDAVILIDAAPRGGTPGSLYLLEPEIPAAHGASLETHAMNPLAVLTAAKSMGARLDRVLLLGCEPCIGQLEGIGLSGPVQRALEEAVKMVEDLVAQFLCTSSALPPVS